MRVVYYADDGAEFDTEHECREHEKKVSDILAELMNNTHAYGDKGNSIDFSQYDDYDWEEVFQDISYIQFDTQKAIDCIIEHVYCQYGLLDIASDIHREVRPGERYFYDWDKDEWACLDDRQRALDKIANVFK